MNRRVLVFTAFIALCASTAWAGLIWDAQAEFDVTAQPINGVWTYGYGVGPNDYRGTFDYPVGTATDGGWTRSMGGSPDYSPYMWCNKTDTAGIYPAQSLVLSSGWGGEDYHTYVRWTAPADGWYQVDSRYEMMTYTNGSYWTGEMDVTTVVNGVNVFADYVSGYDYQQYNGAWPAYSPGPKTSTGTYYLQAGQTVDFVGGVGWVDAAYDFVNIAGCKVTAVPEPGTLILLVLGLAGVAAYSRLK
jgi:hypothetical protein